MGERFRKLKRVKCLVRGETAFAFLPRHVDLEQDILHLAKALGRLVELGEMLFFANRMHERCAGDDLGDLARLDVSDEMPGLLRQLRHLSGKDIGTVLAEIMGSRGDGCGDGGHIDRLGNGDDLHFARIAPARSAHAGKLFERFLIMLSEWHGYASFRNAMAPWRPHVPPDALYEKYCCGLH